MHPKQAELIERLDTVTASLSRTAAPAVLYKYTDDEGSAFWLSVKKTTIKSPYTGKSFSAKPQKASPSAVAKDLKSGDGGKAILFKYTDEDGNEFWLPQKKSPARSPFSGKTVTKPEKDSISEVAKDLKTDKKAGLIGDREAGQVKRKLLLDVVAPLKGLAKLVDDGVYDRSGEQDFRIPGMVNQILKHAQWAADLLVDNFQPDHTASSHTAATPVLYKYVDEDGNEFWLKEKKSTAKSPYSGKTVKFEQGNKDSLSEVQKDLKSDAKKASTLIAALDALGLE